MTDIVRDAPASSPPPPDGGCADEGAGALPLPGPNNVRGVTDPELLYFGPDYLVLNIARLPQYTDASSIVLLEQAFAGDESEIVWGTTGVSLKRKHGTFRGNRIVYLTYGRHKILTVEEVLEDSQMKRDLGYPYDFRISFYSALSCFVRLALLRQGDFFDPFLDDIRARRILHALSRLDVCADVTNISVIDVLHGIDILCPDKAKKFYVLGADKLLSVAETISYGRSNNPDWHARFYNKLIEATLEDKKRGKPSKEDIFPEYFDYAQVTRIETELKGACRDMEVAPGKSLDLESALDMEVQLGLFLKLLDGKYAKWGVAEFVRTAMRDRGFAPWDVKRNTLTPERISNMPAIIQYKNRGLNLAERCGIPLDKLNTICEQLLFKQPPYDVQVAGCKQFSFDDLPDIADAGR